MRRITSFVLAVCLMAVVSIPLAAAEEPTLAGSWVQSLMQWIAQIPDILSSAIEGDDGASGDGLPDYGPTGDPVG